MTQDTTPEARARELAEQVVSAANIVSHDGYYELDIDAVTAVLSAALTLSDQRDGWQPIETAPKGEPGFLACDDDYDNIEWLYDNGDKERFFNQNSGNYTPRRHWKYWRPRPAPPLKSPNTGEIE